MRQPLSGGFFAGSLPHLFHRGGLVGGRLVGGRLVVAIGEQIKWVEVTEVTSMNHISSPLALQSRLGQSHLITNKRVNGGTKDICYGPWKAHLSLC